MYMTVSNIELRPISLCTKCAVLLIAFANYVQLAQRRATTDAEGTRERESMR